LASVHLSAPVRQAISAQALQLSAITPPAGLDAVTRTAVDHAISSATVSAFRATMIISAVIALAAAGVGATTLPPARRTRRH
jgi:hypothetical protein